MDGVLEDLYSKIRKSDFKVRFFVFLQSVLLSTKNNKKYININLVEN